MRVLLTISLALNVFIVAGVVALATSPSLATDTAEALGWATVEQVEQQSVDAATSGRQALAKIEAICSAAQGAQEGTNEIAGRVRQRNYDLPGISHEAQAYTLDAISSTLLEVQEGCDS